MQDACAANVGSASLARLGGHVMLHSSRPRVAGDNTTCPLKYADTPLPVDDRSAMRQAVSDGAMDHEGVRE